MANPDHEDILYTVWRAPQNSLARQIEELIRCADSVGADRIAVDDLRLLLFDVPFFRPLDAALRAKEQACRDWWETHREAGGV